MRFLASALLGCLLTLSGRQALALDAASAAKDCESIRQAALDGATRSVEAYTPRVNPVTTFNNSTQTCLDNISRYKSLFSGFPGLPGLPDLQSVLQGISDQFMRQACNAAEQQFRRAVNDSLGAVNGTIRGATRDATGGVYTAPSVTIQNGQATVSGGTSVESTARSTVNNAINRVINVFN